MNKYGVVEVGFEFHTVEANMVTVNSNGDLLFWRSSLDIPIEGFSCGTWQRFWKEEKSDAE